MTSLRRENTSREKENGVPLSSFDWRLAAVMLLLLCIGLLMVFSASGAIAERLYDDKYLFFKRQCLYAAIGGIALIITANLPRKLVLNLQYPLLFGVIFLLLLTLTPLGLKVNGASRWLAVGPFSIQPLEFAKPALAIYLAYFMSTKQQYLGTFTRGVLPPFLVTLLLCSLLLCQPDFGGAFTLVMILFAMCLVGGTHFIYLFFAITAGFGAAYMLVINSPYRMRRLLAFIDPFKDMQDTGYQLVQSLYALGSGGFFGVGLGGGAQKMLYLPEAHTDFIMAVVGEELGFFGISIIMALFFIFFLRCYKIIVGQQDLHARLFAFAVALVLGLGAMQNLAVVLGMVPPKGVAMPFMSYGGSCLVSSMICVGLLLNFSRTVRQS